MGISNLISSGISFLSKAAKPLLEHAPELISNGTQIATAGAQIAQSAKAGKAAKAAASAGDSIATQGSHAGKRAATLQPQDAERLAPAPKHRAPDDVASRMQALSE